MRVIVGLLLLAILAPIGAWYALPWWLPPVAERLAPRYGVQLGQLELERPAIDSARVIRVSGTWRDPASGAAADFEIEGIVLGWRPRVAWRERRLDWVGIDQLRLALVMPATAQEADAGIDLRIPTEPLEQLPVAAWRVGNIEARWTSGAETLTATGAMEGRGSDLLGGIRVQRGTEEALRISLGGRAGREHRVTISAPLDGRAHQIAHVRETREPGPGGSILTAGNALVDIDALTRVLPGLAEPVAEIPHASGRLELEWDGRLPGVVNPDKPWDGVELDGRLQVQARADAIAGQPVTALHLQADASFAVTGSQLQWTLADDLGIALASPDLDALAHESLGFDGSSVLRVMARSPVRGRLDLGTRELQDVEGAFDVQALRGERRWLRQKLALRAVHARLAGAPAFGGAVETSGILFTAPASTLPVRQFEWQVRGNAAGDVDQLRFTPAGEVRVQGVTAGANNRPAPVAARLRFGAPVRVGLADGSLRAGNIDAWFEFDWRDWVDAAGGELPDFRHGSVQASFREVLIENNQQRVKGSWRVEGLEARSGEAGIGPLVAKGSMDSDGKTVRVHAQLVTGRSAKMLMQGNLTYDLAREAVTVEADSARLGFPAATAQLQDVLRPWPAELVLNGGSVAGQVRARGLPDAVSGQGRIDVERLFGSWDEIPFSGLNVGLPFGLEVKDLALGPVEIHLRQVDPGFPVRNIRMRIAAQGSVDGELPPLEISDFSAELLGGRVFAPRLVLDPAAAVNRFDLQVEGIVLKELLRLEQQAELSGSGVLDGTLPVTWSQDGISIAKGALQAREPGGFLRYSASIAARNLARTNPGVRIALDALRNFHYHLLRADVDYAPDGRLVLGLKIHGQNPDLKDGHPVHLNVNVEENVLTLLRSLQVSDTVSDKVGKSIEKRRSP